MLLWNIWSNFDLGLILYRCYGFFKSLWGYFWGLILNNFGFLRLRNSFNFLFINLSDYLFPLIFLYIYFKSQTFSENIRFHYPHHLFCCKPLSLSLGDAFPHLVLIALLNQSFDFLLIIKCLFRLVLFVSFYHLCIFGLWDCLFALFFNFLCCFFNLDLLFRLLTCLNLFNLRLCIEIYWHIPLIDVYFDLFLH